MTNMQVINYWNDVICLTFVCTKQLGLAYEGTKCMCLTQVLTNPISLI
jgi:hypothetical protein